MTPARLAHLVNVVARNAEIDARAKTGPWAESAQAASDAVRELAEAVATARLDGVRAGLAAASEACGAVVDEWCYTPPSEATYAARACLDSVSALDPDTIAGSP